MSTAAPEAPAASLQYDITQVLKKTDVPLNAAAIRREVATKHAGITKSVINKVLYRLKAANHVVQQAPEDGSLAPLWVLCSELQNEPDAAELGGEVDGEPTRGNRAPQ